jgi:hypothetical protein
MPQEYKPPVGWTIKWGKDGFQVLPFEKGLWARYFKLDLFMCRWMRPVPRGAPTGTPIRDSSWRSFGKELVKRLTKKNPLSIPRAEVREYKYDENNPWKGRFLFVLDTKWRVPSVFLSLFGRFYVGIKTYSAENELPDPYDARHSVGGDITWMGEGVPTGRYGCPSATMRSKRTDG